MSTTTTTDYAKWRDFAVTIAAEAATRAKAMVRAGFTADLKANGTVITQIDLAVERYLRDEIGKAYPHHAILGEEFGFVGTTFTIGLLFALVARGYHIAGRSKDPFGSLLATGITSIIAVQAFENIAVVTGVIPATGIPLPFLSYGGSSLVATLGSLGVLLNISQHPFRRSPREMREELKRVADEEDARAATDVARPGAGAWRSPAVGRHGIIVGPEARN